MPSPRERTRSASRRAKGATEETGRGCLATKQARDTLAKQLEDGEVVRAIRITTLDTSLRGQCALILQFESGESIRDASITAFNTIRRDLLPEANQSASPNANRRAEGAAGEAGRSFLKTRQARYTLIRQLENGEAARAASITALDANLRTQRALIQ